MSSSEACRALAFAFGALADAWHTYELIFTGRTEVRLGNHLSNRDAVSVSIETSEGRYLLRTVYSQGGEIARVTEESAVAAALVALRARVDADLDWLTFSESVAAARVTLRRWCETTGESERVRRASF